MQARKKCLEFGDFSIFRAERMGMVVWGPQSSPQIINSMMHCGAPLEMSLLFSKLSQRFHDPTSSSQKPWRETSLSPDPSIPAAGAWSGGGSTDDTGWRGDLQQQVEAALSVPASSPQSLALVITQENPWSPSSQVGSNWSSHQGTSWTHSAR